MNTTEPYEISGSHDEELTCNVTLVYLRFILAKDNSRNGLIFYFDER